MPGFKSPLIRLFSVSDLIAWFLDPADQAILVRKRSSGKAISPEENLREREISTRKEKLHRKKGLRTKHISFALSAQPFVLLPCSFLVSSPAAGHALRIRSFRYMRTAAAMSRRPARVKQRVPLPPVEGSARPVALEIFRVYT